MSKDGDELSPHHMCTVHTVARIVHYELTNGLHDEFGLLGDFNIMQNSTAYI